MKKRLEESLQDRMGKPVAVVVRNAEEMQAVLATCPCPESPPSYAFAFFLDRPPPADALAGARNVDGERMWLGRREIYVHYPNGMGRSRLRLPAAQIGTARNMNTIAALTKMARHEALF